MKNFIALNLALIFIFLNLTSSFQFLIVSVFHSSCEWTIEIRFYFKEEIYQIFHLLNFYQFLVIELNLII